MDKKQVASVGNLVLEEMIACDKSIWGSDVKENITILETHIRIFSDYIIGVNFSKSSRLLIEGFQKQLISIAAISLLIISANKREFLLWNKVLDRTFDLIDKYSVQDSFYALDIEILFAEWIKISFEKFNASRIKMNFEEDILFSIAARSIILYTHINLISTDVRQEVA